MINLVKKGSKAELVVATLVVMVLAILQEILPTLTMEIPELHFHSFLVLQIPLKCS